MNRVQTLWLAVLSGCCFGVVGAGWFWKGALDPALAWVAVVGAAVGWEVSRRHRLDRSQELDHWAGQVARACQALLPADAAWVVTDRDLRVRWASSGYCKMEGRTAETVIGTVASLGESVDSFPRERKKVMGTLRNGGMWRQQESASPGDRRRWDGERAFAGLRGTGLDGGFILGLGRSAGMEEAPSEELRKGNEALSAQLLQVTTDFAQFKRDLEMMAFGVGHQLRSARIGQVDFVPVLTGVGSSQISDRVRQEVEWMMRSSSRMLRMFEDFACLHELRVRPLELEPVDLSALAQEVVDGYAKLDPNRSVVIEIEPDLSVVGDLRLMRMLLRSLIARAWRSSKDDPNARIAFGSVRSESGGTGRAFYVRDSGRRVQRGELSRALTGEDFSEVHDANGESRVAMKVVQRIVERHQGRVSFETVPNQEATIRFTIGEVGRIERSLPLGEAA